ncbi:MAG: AraC family transcriptional regulator [Turicibacter sp.]
MSNNLELKENFQHGDALFPMNYYEGNYNDVYLHWHDEMEIIYIKSGQGIFYVNFKPYEFKEGDFFIIPTGSLHWAKMEGGICCDLQTIVFNLNFLMSFRPDTIQIKYINPIKNKDITLPIHITKYHEQYQKLSPLIFTLMKSIQDKEFGYELFVKSSFYHLFFLLLNTKRNELLIPNRDHKELTNIEKIKNIITHVDTHFDSPLSIEEMAMLTGFSPHYFCHFFKKQTGQTFFVYLNRYRIEKAKDMLRNSDDTITTIAFNTGFQDLSYFIRTFKKYTLASPAVYRKTYIQQINDELLK